MSDRPSLNPETGTPWSRAELKAAFDLVANRSHWKNPIRRTVPAGTDLELVREAVIFYTGSVPEFSTKPDGSTLVVAIGYFAAVGA